MPSIIDATPLAVTSLPVPLVDQADGFCRAIIQAIRTGVVTPDLAGMAITAAHSYTRHTKQDAAVAFRRDLANYGGQPVRWRPEREPDQHRDWMSRDGYSGDTSDTWLLTDEEIRQMVEVLHGEHLSAYAS